MKRSLQRGQCSFAVLLSAVLDSWRHHTSFPPETPQVEASSASTQSVTVAAAFVLCVNNSANTKHGPEEHMGNVTVQRTENTLLTAVVHAFSAKIALRIISAVIHSLTPGFWKAVSLSVTNSRLCVYLHWWILAVVEQGAVEDSVVGIIMSSQSCWGST